MKMMNAALQAWHHWGRFQVFANVSVNCRLLVIFGLQRFQSNEI